MAEEDLSQISAGQFETVSQLIASSESLQIAFSIMIIGIIGIVIGYRKFSYWVGSQKFFCNCVYHVNQCSHTKRYFVRR
jgi:hypothetical protein